MKKIIPAEGGGGGVLPGVQLKELVPPVKHMFIAGWGGWWLSGCRRSVAEHWHLNYQ